MICENYRKGGSVRELAKKFWEAQAAMRPWASIGLGYLDYGFSFNHEMSTELRNQWRSADAGQGDEI